MLTRRMILFALAALVGIVLVACGEDDPGTGAGADDDCETGVEQEVTEGLTYTEIECGDGEEAESGDTVTVHYTGTLEDGTEFDSSVGKEPFPFTIGSGMVIEGWEQGVPGMKVGGTRELTIDSALAYGDQDYGPIPGGSTLIFEIELLEISSGESP
jgi:FKBP-type peptidyl-prolyl cis-trans isomerase FkpA